MRPAGPWIGLLSLVLLVSGCGMGAAGRQRALEYAAYRFNSDVRWRRHQSAAQLLAPALRQPYQDRTENPDDPVRVSSVEILRATFEGKKTRAVLRVRYQWLRNDRGILRKTVVVEHWRNTGKSWLIDRLEHGSGPKFPWFENLKPAPRRRSPKARPPAKRPAPR